MSTYHGLGLITAVLVREREASTGWVLWCLRCQRTTWYVGEVVYVYCGSCNLYHPGAPVARADRQPFAEADDVWPPQMPW
jgi:hypothetical protein